MIVLLYFTLTDPVLCTKSLIPSEFQLSRLDPGLITLRNSLI